MLSQSPACDPGLPRDPEHHHHHLHHHHQGPAALFQRPRPLLDFPAQGLSLLPHSFLRMTTRVRVALLALSLTLTHRKWAISLVTERDHYLRRKTRCSCRPLFCSDQKIDSPSIARTELHHPVRSHYATSIFSGNCTSVEQLSSVRFSNCA
jgi:hypothetical protein